MGLGSGRRWQWLERNLYLGMLRQCQRGEWAQDAVFIYRNDGLVHISLLYEGVYYCTSTRRNVSVNQHSVHLLKEEARWSCLSPLELEALEGPTAKAERQQGGEQTEPDDRAIAQIDFHTPHRLE